MVLHGADYCMCDRSKRKSLYSMFSKPIKTDIELLQWRKIGYLLVGATQENGELMFKSPQLSNDLEGRVFKNKIWVRDLLRRWNPLTVGPLGHISRCSAITCLVPWRFFPSQETWNLKNIFIPYIRISLDTSGGSIFRAVLINTL